MNNDTAPDTNALKLRFKLGDNEVELEGNKDVVRGYVETWIALVRNEPMPTSGITSTANAQGDHAKANVATTSPSLHTIMKVDQHIVSLHARQKSLDDEIVLLLLGHRMLLGRHMVSGSELMAGLRHTGEVDGRIDYRLNRLERAGDVVTAGWHRARRYALTNRGHARANAIAKALMGS